MRVRPSPCIVLALALAGCQSEPGYTLRFQEPVGSKLTYDYVTKASSDPSGVKDRSTWSKLQLTPSSFDVTGELVTEVVKSANGKITVKAANRPITAKGTGFGDLDAKELLKKGVQTLSYDVDDRRRFTDPKTVMDPLTNTMNGLFPEKAVKVGETWEYKPFPDSPPGKATLKKLETVAGVQTVMIHIQVPGGEKEDTQMDAWFDPKDGRLVKATIVSKVDQDGMLFYSDFTQTLKAGAPK
jgi:hypothetical protein